MRAHAFQGILAASADGGSVQIVLSLAAKDQSPLGTARARLGIAEGLLGVEEPGYLASEPCWPMTIFHPELK